MNGKEDSLGINAVWLSPFYRSPMADFGYDVSDFISVDPVFGDMEIFAKLVSELHKRDIKLIVDYVGNHTSGEHSWFVESRSSKDNPKRDWYVWKDGRSEKEPPNNWMSVFGGSAWEFDPTTKQYYLHSFLSAQPDLNWRNPEVRAEMMRVIDFWVKKGVDGFRIDALQHFVEDKDFRDDAPNPTYYPGNDDPYKLLVHDNSLGNSEGMGLVADFITEALDRHPDIFIVGEAYVGTKDLRKLYELNSSGRFAPFNFNLIGSKWEAAEWKRIIDEYQAMLQTTFLPNYVFGNHDVSRLATRLGEAKSRVAAFLQHTLPGMPFIYYGEELGMINGTIPHEVLQDFLAKIFRGFHPGRDLERTPMQWDDSLHAGFSTTRPWLPVGDSYKTDNVAREKTDPNSMFSLYKSLIEMRKNNPVLRYGEYIPRQSNSPSVFSFERKLGDEHLVIYANFGENIETENLPPHRGKPNIKFSTSSKDNSLDFSGDESGNGNENGKLKLLPLEAYIVSLF